MGKTALALLLLAMSLHAYGLYKSFENLRLGLGPFMFGVCVLYYIAVWVFLSATEPI